MNASQLRRRIRPSRQSMALVLAAVGVVVGALLGGPVAGAHGGEGVLTVMSVTQPPEGGSLTVVIQVRLTFESDGHPADDATVTVAGASQAGTPITPVAMESAGDGNYWATLGLPGAGTWSLRVVAVEPPAEVALDPITAVGAGTTVPGATVPGATQPDGSGPDAANQGASAPGATDSDASTSVPVGVTPTTLRLVDPSAVDGDDAAAEADDDGSDGVPAWIFIGGIALVALALAATWLHRRSAANPDEPSDQ